VPQTETSSHLPKTQETQKIPIYVQEKCDAPVWNIGDTWKFQQEDKKSWEIKVIRIEDNLYFTEFSYVAGYSISNEFLTFDKNTLEFKFSLDKEGKRTEPMATFIDLDFPLYVGKKWSKMVSATLPMGGYRLREFTCTSYENITVPAGTFRTLKIRFKSTNMSGEGSGEAYIWYSPEVKRHIKMVFENTRYWINNQNYELISFKLKDRPSPPQEIKLPPPPRGVDLIQKPQASLPEKPQISIPITTPPSINLAVVTGTFANIRSGAGNEFSIVNTVKQGDKLILLGEYGDWLNVRLENGQEGWINNKFVK
jgi:hypothetical protein